MSFWEFFWNMNEGTVSFAGWLFSLIVVILILVFAIVGFLWRYFNKYISPKIKDLFASIENHSLRIRDLEENARALAKADIEIIENQKTHLEVAKEMVHYSNSLVENMRTTCDNFQKLNDILNEKVETLDKQLSQLLTEHHQRHKDEIIKYTKPRKKV